jgi:hypothetical protein
MWASLLYRKPISVPLWRLPGRSCCSNRESRTDQVHRQESPALFGGFGSPLCAAEHPLPGGTRSSSGGRRHLGNVCLRPLARARAPRRTYGGTFFWRDRTPEVDFVVDLCGHLELFEAKWTEVPASLPGKLKVWFSRKTLFEYSLCVWRSEFRHCRNAR